MAGIGGYATRLNGTENFNSAANTSATNVASLVSYIGEVTNIGLPEITVGDIDVSSFDSEENYNEFVAGMKEPGVIPIELNYDPDEVDLLLAAVGGPNEIWQISIPDESIFKTDGYMNKIVGGAAVANDKLSCVAQIKCSGKPTHSTSFSFTQTPAA